MDNRKGVLRSGSGDVACTAGTMLLCVLFAACMLMTVAAAASTYGRIQSGYQQSFGDTAAVRYIANKLRSAEKVTIFEDGTAAAAENGGMVSVLYSGGDGVYEKTQAAGDELSAAGGDLISECGAVTIAEHDGLFEITVRSGGESSVLLVRKGCSG